MIKYHVPVQITETNNGNSELSLHVHCMPVINSTGAFYISMSKYVVTDFIYIS